MSLRIIAALTFFVALSPFSPASASDLDVVLVLDASGSMNADVNRERKFDAARKTVRSLLLILEKRDISVGLIVFGHRNDRCDDIEVAVELGLKNRKTIEAYLQSISATGSTPLAASIEKAGAILKKRGRKEKRIIVLTDGADTCRGDPQGVARALIKLGIKLKIHVVGFDVKSFAAAELKATAAAGQGDFYAAKDAAQLLRAFQGIGTKLKKIAPPKVKVSAKPKPASKPAPKPAPKVVKKPTPPAPVTPAPKKPEKTLAGAKEAAKGKRGSLLFVDNFKREELGKSWTVLNPDEERGVVDDGFLVITTLAKKDKGSNKIKAFNSLQFNYALPEDYEIEIEWEIPFKIGNSIPRLYTCQAQQLQMIVSSGSTQLSLGMLYETIDYGRKGVLSTSFEKTLKGKKNALPLVEKVASTKELKVQKVRFKLRKKRFTYTAWIQRSGTGWKKVGQHKLLRCKKPNIEIRQFNRDSRVPEVECKIKKFAIYKLK
ncbi:MAG: VWA domain-containing protein [Planctomycetota bacterium]|nr:VWA domain-containing protein [Planctomycetota bacterium]